MTSGVPKNYHGGVLRGPRWHQAEAGGVFPWEATHWLGSRLGNFTSVASKGLSWGATRPQAPTGPRAAGFDKVMGLD